MRLRFAVLASVLSALVLAVPATSGAAPRHDRGLTINVAPTQIIAGEAVVIYGQLNAGTVAGQTILLYHHVAGSHRGYTLIGSRKTNSYGLYQFPRGEGVVTTNRSWFVRELGGQMVHSRTVGVQVSALVSLAAGTTNTDTNHAVTFTGHVTPNHAFERVLLQAHTGSGDRWVTLASTRLGRGSGFAFRYRWRVPGVRDVRAVFGGDNRNTAAASDPVTVSIQQAQIADFTIHSSAPVINEGSAATISGILDRPGSTAPQQNTSVTLWARATDQPHFIALDTTSTRSDGGYSFGVKPIANFVYQVRTTFAPHRHSAELFEGVRDVLTLTATPAAVNSGQPVTFTGSVVPDKAGDVVYLQRLGSDGDWHTVAVQHVRPDSTYEFVRTFGAGGPKIFRARVPGDPLNVGGASNTVTVNVTVPPVLSPAA